MALYVPKGFRLVQFRAIAHLPDGRMQRVSIAREYHESMVRFIDRDEMRERVMESVGEGAVLSDEQFSIISAPLGDNEQEAPDGSG